MMFGKSFCSKSLKNSSSAISIHRAFLSSGAHHFKIDNPYSLQTLFELPYCSTENAIAALNTAVRTQEKWKKVSLDERIKLCNEFMTQLEKTKDEVAHDISASMGKPKSQALGEVNGMFSRIRGLLSIAHEALADDVLPQQAGNFRTITKEPIGVVLSIAPWNYPLLTVVNSLIPAILAGNTVLLKHSPRTAHCGDHIEKAFLKAGAPKGLVTSIHTNDHTTETLIQNPHISFVSFTGSVPTGRKVYQNVAKSRFIDVTLELGGKDPAYVRADANIEYAAAGLIDGAMYNAGQSCCGVERIYVHRDCYSQFLSQAELIVKQYVLGDPLDPSTTMGPMALPTAPAFLDAQVKQAVKAGAIVRCGGTPVVDDQGKGRFFAPTLLSDCTNGMDIMSEESFGPVIGVTRVDSDEEAIKLMNDSKYGLTSAIYTHDVEKAKKIAESMQTGTVYMNRCDSLDPLLCWTGVKDTGKGGSLSIHGFKSYYRLKSYNFKLQMQ
eukprot:c15674_g1_i1.p1 GENE.c15674_g1_i1~~c15674_g1_i1.p1  ORF type:complete len:494 (-),score=220.36 c15674_g1_i1:105-1586(-)